MATLRKPKKKFKPVLLTAGDSPEFLRMMVYGNSGVGKTQFCGTAVEVPGMRRVLVVDCGTSTDTLIAEPQFKDIMIFRATKWDELQDIYEWLLPIEEGGQGNPEGIKTVILDELNTIYRSLLEKVIAHKVMASKGKRIDTWEIHQSDYGDARRMMHLMINSYLQLNINLLVTALVYEATTELGPNMYLPNLCGKLAYEIPGRFSSVGYLTVDTPVRLRKKNMPSTEEEQSIEFDTRIMHFVGNRKFIAKWRGQTETQLLGSEFENPTLPKILNAINKKGTN